MSQEPKSKTYVKDSFFLTYLVLMGYTTITLIEAVRTPSTNVRHIMNLETTVSLVATIVYSLFIERLKDPATELKDITKFRYTDWLITTPLILLALLLFYNQSLSSIPYQTYFSIVVLNWLMLGAGYMGETGIIEKQAGGLLGFGFFIALLYTMVSCCIPSTANLSGFAVFALLWTGYGVAYYLDEETKNLMYNILDLCSKALFGVGLWFFYGKVLKF